MRANQSLPESSLCEFAAPLNLCTDPAIPAEPLGTDRWSHEVPPQEVSAAELATADVTMRHRSERNLGAISSADRTQADSCINWIQWRFLHQHRNRVFCQNNHSF